jgi:hypothetical protein
VGRHPSEWANSDWPHWENLAYLAGHIHDQITGQEDSINDALTARGHRRPSDPSPTDQPWNSDSLTEIQRRLPRLAALFPRQRHLTP